MFVTILVSWCSSSPAMCICWLATSLVIFDYVIKCPELHSLNTSLTIPVLTPTALCSPGRTAIIIRLSLSCFLHGFIVYREDVCYEPCKIFSASFSLRVRRGNGGKKGFPLLDQRNYSRLEWGVWCHSNWQNNHHHHHQTLCISCFFLTTVMEYQTKTA